MIENITKRQRDVLRLIAEGLSNKEIARKLNISPNTINTHVLTLFHITGVKNRTQLAILGIKSGLLIEQKSSLTESGDVK